MNIEYAEEYKYLGLYLNSQLDWSKTVKILSQSAARALGVIIAKDKACGGFDNTSFTHLFDAAVKPIMEYGTELYYGVIGIIHASGLYKIGP
jgi:hypothetical protein